MAKNTYQELGYINREAYLRGLASSNGVSYATVLEFAELLGPNEDFDSLVTELEDFTDMFGE